MLKRHKFPQSVLEAVAREECTDAFDAAEKLSAFSHLEIPKQISALRDAKVRFDEVLDKDQMGINILENLGKAKRKKKK